MERDLDLVPPPGPHDPAGDGQRYDRDSRNNQSSEERKRVRHRPYSRKEQRAINTISKLRFLRPSVTQL